MMGHGHPAAAMMHGMMGHGEPDGMDHESDEHGPDDEEDNSDEP